MSANDRFDSLFRHYAPAGIPWTLLKRQAEVESAMDPDAVSPVGACGLTQFMPGTFSEIAGKLGLVHASAFDPEDSIRCQARYMGDLMDRFGHDQRLALAAYNWGGGNVRKAQAAHGAAWEVALPMETRNYLARVLGA